MLKYLVDIKCPITLSSPVPILQDLVQRLVRRLFSFIIAVSSDKYSKSLRNVTVVTDIFPTILYICTVSLISHFRYYHVTLTCCIAGECTGCRRRILPKVHTAAEAETSTADSSKPTGKAGCSTPEAYLPAEASAQAGGRSLRQGRHQK